MINFSDFNKKELVGKYICAFRNSSGSWRRVDKITKVNRTSFETDNGDKYYVDKDWQAIKNFSLLESVKLISDEEAKEFLRKGGGY